MAANQLLSFFDVDATVINLRTPAEARAGRNYLAVIDFVTLNIVCGATGGSYGIEIYTPDSNLLARLVSDLDAGATDTIHVEWQSGLPCFRIDTSVAASGAGVTAAFHAEQGESLGATSKPYIVPIAADNDATFAGVIGYHYESRSRGHK